MSSVSNEHVMSIVSWKTSAFMLSWCEGCHEPLAGNAACSSVDPCINITVNHPHVKHIRGDESWTCTAVTPNGFCESVKHVPVWQFKWNVTSSWVVKSHSFVRIVAFHSTRIICVDLESGADRIWSHFVSNSKKKPCKSWISNVPAIAVKHQALFSIHLPKLSLFSR